MKKTIFQVERMERKSRLFVLALMVGIWLLTIGIVMIVAFCMGNAGEWEMVAIGTFFVLGILLAGRYISFQDFAKHYTLAVRMERSRRDFLIGHVVSEMIFIVISFMLIYLLYRVELFLYGQLGIVNYEISLNGFFAIEPLLCLTLVLSVMSMFVGAVFMWKAWLPWVFWCVACLSAGRIGAVIDHINEKSGLSYEIYKWLSHLNMVGKTGIVLVIAVLMAAAARKILYSRNM